MKNVSSLSYCVNLRASYTLFFSRDTIFMIYNPWEHAYIHTPKPFTSLTVLWFLSFPILPSISCYNSSRIYHWFQFLLVTSQYCKLLIINYIQGLALSYVREEIFRFTSTNPCGALRDKGKSLWSSLNRFCLCYNKRDSFCSKWEFGVLKRLQCLLAHVYGIFPCQ